MATPQLALAAKIPLDFPIQVQSLLAEMQKYPYENLSKIRHFKLKDPSSIQTEEAIQLEHIEKGMGGTCFALTFHLKKNLEEAGFKTEYTMGDKYNQKNIHCALLFNHQNAQYLLDPGYMVYIPLRIPKENTVEFTRWEPNDITLKNEPHSISMYTGGTQNLNLRFTFRKEKVSETDFFSFWKNTFHFPMMKYPVLNRLERGVQYYLQKNMLVERSRLETKKTQLDPKKLVEIIHRKFKLDYDLAAEALTLLNR